MPIVDALSLMVVMREERKQRAKFEAALHDKELR